MKKNKEFNNWLKKKMKWIFEPTSYLNYQDVGFHFCPKCGGDLTKQGFYKGSLCLHSVSGGDISFRLQNERKRYLIEAYHIAIKAKSFKEIKQRKNENKDWYWSYLMLKDWQRENRINEKTK